MAFILKEGTNGWDGTDQATADAIKAALKGQGLSIRTADEDETFAQAQIDDAFSRRNTEIEGNILEATGIPKNAGEKYLDYLKRATKTKADEVTALTAKVKELEKSNPESEAIKELKAQLKTVQDSAAAAKATYEKEISEIKASSFNDRVAKALDEQIGKLVLKTYSEDAAENKRITDDLLKVAKEKFLSENKPHESEGVIVFKNKEGNIIRNGTSGHPESLDVLLKPSFDHLVNKGHQQGGAGSGNGGQGNPNPGGAGGNGGAKDWKTIKLPSTVKSQLQLTDYLKKDHKLDETSKEFSDAFAALNKGEADKPLPFRAPA